MQFDNKTYIYSEIHLNTECRNGQLRIISTVISPTLGMWWVGYSPPQYTDKTAIV